MNEYWKKDIEYPELANGEILPLGVRHDYVSSSFLNGFVNYVKPVSARVIGRYQDRTKSAERIAAWKKNPPAHAELRIIGDDVLLLAKAADRAWWFFWFDCDVSDCCIGRFKTNDADADVIEKFTRCADFQSKENIGTDSLELPIDLLRGWISF